MSLSSQTEKTQYPSQKCKVFTLESFDELEKNISGHIDESSDFKAFHEETSQENDGFRYVPSDGRERAEKNIEKARIEAEQLVSDAKKKTASIEQEAYEKGYSQGEKDGKEMGAKKIDKVLEKIHCLSQELITCRSEFQRLYKKETLDLICRIAERVVRSTVELDQNVIVDAIFEAFNLAADRTSVKIRVNPGDIEQVKDLRPQFFERFSDLKSVTMESDPSIESGGCVMETDFGHVDARVESQLDKITTAVKEAFNANRGELESKSED